MKLAVVPMAVLTASILLGQDANPTQQPANPAASDASGALSHVDVVARTTKVELYQARNAVQLAKADGADVHAAETFTRAQNQLIEAEQIYAADPKGRATVTLAREAAQTAEDARLIATRRQAQPPDVP